MPDNRIVFDTVTHARKYLNLRRRSVLALVVGWDDETTLQLEGLAEEPAGPDLERCKDAYVAIDPEGRVREAWPDIAYSAVRITWVRYSDGTTATPAAIKSARSASRLSTRKLIITSCPSEPKDVLSGGNGAHIVCASGSESSVNLNGAKPCSQAMPR